MFNIIAFLGPSGTGKTTLQKELGLKPVVTWTTRAMREGEAHGKDYFYTSKENILKMFSEGSLLEYTQYNGNYYGIGADYLNKLIEGNTQGSIVVEANGARVLKDKYPDKVLVVGVLVPFTECKKRLFRRNDQEIEGRLATYQKEVLSVLEISDIIINNTCDNWNKTVEILKRMKR